MYSILKQIPVEDSTNIVHFLIKILNKYKNKPEEEIELSDVKIELDDSQSTICKQLLEEIKPQEIDNDEELDRHITEIYKILEARTIADLKVDVNIGKALLRKMKESDN